jgi:hypothetical protein
VVLMQIAQVQRRKINLIVTKKSEKNSYAVNKFYILL